MCLVGYLAADLASAATRDLTPNALRAIGGAPFAVILAAMILREAVDRFRFAPIAIAVVAWAFAPYFLWAYFGKYPATAHDAFNASLGESARATLPAGNWRGFLAQNRGALSSALHYHLMADGHQSCRESATELREAGWTGP